MRDIIIQKQKTETIPAGKLDEYTTTHRDKEVAEMLASAPVLCTFVSKDTKYLEYCATKEAVTIRDKCGHFGHISIYLTQSSLDWDKLTVGQVVRFLRKYGASKFKATQLKKRRHFVYYN